jgi:uncharacterized protein YcfJ
MKNLLIMTALVASPVSADSVNATVRDIYKDSIIEQPVVEKKCVEVEVPVYGNVTTQGNAGEGALLGMILGGLIGKGVSGNDKGAAAGAVFGGLVGADKGAKNKTKQQITGYKYETRCDNVTRYIDKRVTNYSHSVVKFVHDGQNIELRFNLH